MTRSQCLSFPPGVAFQQMGADQDGVMMSLASGYLYRCNRSATIVLAAIAAGRSPAEAASELSQKFEIEFDRAQQDVDALLTHLMQRQLVRAAA